MTVKLLHQKIYSWLSKYKLYFFIFIAYCFIALIFTFPLSAPSNISNSLVNLPSQHSCNDSCQFIWQMVYVKKMIFHNFFYSNYQLFPKGINMAYTTLVVPISIVAIPLAHFFGVITVFNLSMIMSLVLSAFAGFLLFKYLTKNTLGSFIGGILYGFSPYLMNELVGGHLNLIAGYFIPLYILCLYYILKNYRRVNFIWYGLLLGLLFFLNLITSIEYGISLLLFNVIFLILYALFIDDLYKFKKYKYSIYSLVIGGFTAVILYLPWIYYLKFSSLSLSSATIHTLGFSIGGDRYNRLFSFLNIPNLSSVAMSSFIGWGALIVILIVWKNRKRNKDIKLWLTLWVFFYILSLGSFLSMSGKSGSHTNITMPFNLINRIPYVNAILPYRLTIYFMLATGLLVAFFFEDFYRRFLNFKAIHHKKYLKYLVLLLISAVLIIEIFPNPLFLNKPNLHSMTYNYITRKILPESTLLEVPFVQRQTTVFSTLDILPMLYQANENMGYKSMSAYVPAYSGSQQKYYFNIHLLRNIFALENGTATTYNITRPELIDFTQFFNIHSIVIHKNQTQNYHILMNGFSKNLGMPPQTLDKGNISFFIINPNKYKTYNINENFYLDHGKYSYIFYEGWGTYHLDPQNKLGFISSKSKSTSIKIPTSCKSISVIMNSNIKTNVSLKSETSVKNIAVYPKIQNYTISIPSSRKHSSWQAIYLSLNKGVQLNVYDFKCIN